MGLLVLEIEFAHEREGIVFTEGGAIQMKGRNQIDCNANDYSVSRIVVARQLEMLSFDKYLNFR
jgi:hypothetical protein